MLIFLNFHGALILQIELVPLLLRHFHDIEGSLIVYLANFLEEFLSVERGEAWVWKRAVLENVESEEV